jgi:hypothetical protein
MISKLFDKLDQYSVYCHKTFFNPSKHIWRGDWATIEHLNHLPPWNNSNTVAICCGSCNSSRGVKRISDWFKTKYCIDKNINEKTVARTVQEYLKYIEGFIDEVSWRFAKTMPEIPHYYIVREELSKDRIKIFDEIEVYINKKGYRASFQNKTYNYLNLGDYKYWVIDNILNRAKLIK